MPSANRTNTHKVLCPNRQRSCTYSCSHESCFGVFVQMHVVEELSFLQKGFLVVFVQFSRLEHPKQTRFQEVMVLEGAPYRIV